MLKKKSSHQVEVQESVGKTILPTIAILPVIAILPAKFDKFPLSEMISYHFTGIIFIHGFITQIPTYNM